MNKQGSTYQEKYFDRIFRMESVETDQLSELPCIGVIIGDKYLEHYENQVMTVIAINLLSCLTPNIKVTLPTNITCRIPGFHEKKLNTVIELIVNKNQKEPDLKFTKVTNANNDQTLVIGFTEKPTPTDSIWIDCHKWVAGYGLTSRKMDSIIDKEDSFNIVGASFAACQGVAEIFKSIVGKQIITTPSTFYSLFDFSSDSRIENLPNPDINEEIDFGHVYEIGCGAVGSSFCYLLSLSKADYRIQLIDYDGVEIENLMSSLAFGHNDIKNRKAKCCYDLFSDSIGTANKPFLGDYSNYIESIDYEKSYPDVVLCFANERNVWSTIQENYPPLVLHATTTKNWGINFGRHIPLREWCIVGRFGTKNHEYIPKCGDGVMADDKHKEENDGDEILGTLPFLSPAAAVLCLAELYKLSLSDYPVNKNFATYSFKPFNKPGSFLLQAKNRKSGCEVCSRQNQNIAKAFFYKSKFSENIV